LNAAEVDQFTLLHRQLNDSANIINEQANLSLASAIAQQNRMGSCNRKRAARDLYQNLRYYFHNYKKGQLSIFVNSDRSVERRKILKKNSIYQSINILDGLVLGQREADKSPLAFAPEVRLGSITIGTDKFGHFFSRGFAYFNRRVLKGHTMGYVFLVGLMREKFILGGNIFSSGVFSYADLSANFNGMRFWNHILLKRDDVLGEKHNIGPYVACQEGRWIINQMIDLRRYLDWSFHEAVNCSRMATKRGAIKIKKEIKHLGYQCPYDPRKLEKLAKKYGRFSNMILNREGIGKVKSIFSFF